MARQDVHTGEGREDTPGNLRALLPGDQLRKGLKFLQLDSGYVPNWTTRDAFREFYQNWFVIFTSFEIFLISNMK